MSSPTPKRQGASNRLLLAGLSAVASAALLACNRPPETLLPRQRESIQSRATNSFAQTILLKPNETESNSTPALRLAPLIIQEVAGTNALWQDRWESRTAYVESRTITVNGRRHDQHSYVWHYAGANSGRKSQGVRLTLNTTGDPVIWEVLNDSSGAHIIYVAQSLELAARFEFGPPLPGRKFSIERSLAEAPVTVVANVIDDGPVPMGPVIYLRQACRDVSTLICRCMASQGGMLLGQTNYEPSVAPPQDRSSGFPAAQLDQQLRPPRSF